MPLNKDILGAQLKTASDNWNNKNPDIIGDINAARLSFWTAIAEAVIQHIKTSAVVNVNVSTTGTAAVHTGTGVGTIT